MVESETLTLFAGNANPALAHDIARLSDHAHWDERMSEDFPTVK